jgi:uncharacterized protein (DUF433 family)/DNA-binding transcriptional MerR regulator
VLAQRRKIASMEAPRAIGHYSAAEVGRLAGVSARRVGQWARYGIIPSVSERPRVYSYADAAEAVLVRYLVEIGLKPREVRQIVEDLRAEYGYWPLTSAPLEHDGKLVVIHEGKNIYISALKPGHEVIAGTLIDLKAVRAALERGGWVTWKKPRQHIEVDPERLSGRPTIRGRRVATEVVASIATEDPDGRRLLREEFDLTDAEIDDAIGYEADVSEAVAA